MGCATSMCSCAQTSVSTINPTAHTHIRLNSNSKPRRRSGLSRLTTPSIVSVDAKSSHWSSYDVEIKESDQFSDVHHIRGPCEIESDDEYDPPFVEQQSQHHSARQDPRGLLTERSKWTVTVRLYAQKASDQRNGTEIPSVEETGSHFSSGEWHGKSGSSQGSRGSAKRVLHTNNGMVPQREHANLGRDNKHKPNQLHHSHSEKPFTQTERDYSRHVDNSTNPTYAWGRGGKSRKEPPHVANTSNLSNGPNGSVPFNGLPLTGGRHQQKYEQTTSLSTYLSFGTNHYKQARSSNGSNRRKKAECEENWQGLCEGRSAATTRPRSTHPARNRQDVYRGFDPVCDEDSFFSESPADSLITDYLGDGDIVEDFSGSTHSLSTAGKRASVSTSGKGTSVYETTPDSEIVIDSLIPVLDKLNRPKAALRRHRSEPFHFLA